MTMILGISSTAYDIKTLYFVVVLYMRLLVQFQVCLFFLRKDFEGKKAPKCRINNSHLLKSFCANKKLLPFLFGVCLILFC